ncbi:hypothetical protein V8D89_006728 [Ganoderma adspersum]
MQGEKQIVEALGRRAEALNLEHWGGGIIRNAAVQRGPGDAEGQGKLCGACAEDLYERNRREQKKIFDKLPKLFCIEVEGWGKENSESEVA